MKRSLIMFGIMSLLVVSLAYAGVLNYYGKIVGNVNVQGPIFYASTNCSDSVCKLYINSLPSEYSGELTKGYVYFKSEPLGVDNWYKARWKIFLKLKGTTDNQKVDYDLRLRNSEYKTICSSFITISTSVSETSISCNSDKIEGLTSQYYLELKLTSENNFVIYADGSTRIEVNKA
jgi:hypothetical protein